MFSFAVGAGLSTWFTKPTLMSLEPVTLQNTGVFVVTDQALDDKGGIKIEVNALSPSRLKSLTLGGPFPG